MKKIIMIVTIAVTAVFCNTEIHFEQRTFWKIRERESKVKGKIIIADGDKFNLSIGKMNFVSNGETLWEYNNRQKQLRILNAKESVSVPDELLGLLKEAESIDNKTSFVLEDENTVTTYTVEKVILLNAVDESLFNFVIPQGTQIYEN